MKLRLSLYTLGAMMLNHTCGYSQNGLAIPTDNPMKTSLDSMVDARAQLYFTDKKAVALSIGIYQNEKTFYYNYGETYAGSKVLPTNKTYYELGSITKSLTGILLAQASIDKKLRLDDDIRKYLQGDYPNLEYQGKPIRIVDLSNHTSRITRIFPNLFSRADYDSLDPFVGYNRARLYEGLHQMKMDTLPGVIYSYSNMGIGVLGNILEDVYKQPYMSLLKKYITGPLKMNDTKIDVSGVPPARLAKAHDSDRKIIPWWNISDQPAVGSLRSTTTDMLKYIKANNEKTNPAIVLSHQPTFGTIKEGMGLNWFIHTTPTGFTVLEHTGGTGGSRSALELFPQLNAGFVILTNSLADRNTLQKEIEMIVTGGLKP